MSYSAIIREVPCSSSTHCPKWDVPIKLIQGSVNAAEKGGGKIVRAREDVRY